MTGQPQVLSVQRRFWELIADGWSSEDAGVAVGVSATCGGKWFRRFGGVNPRMQEPRGQKRPRLSADEREQIMIGTAQGESIRSIADRLGRAPSTIMREIANYGVARKPHRGATGRCTGSAPIAAGWARQVGRTRHGSLDRRRSEERATLAERRVKLAHCPALRDKVQALLTKKYSPEQISRAASQDLSRPLGDRDGVCATHDHLHRRFTCKDAAELRRELARKVPA